MKPPIHIADIPTEAEKPFPQALKSKLGTVEWRRLGDHFDLQQFGVNHEIIQPGACSALRHWHSHADEFVYVVDGEMTLITDDGEMPICAGMCVGFRGGEANGHHMVNRSSLPATILAMGSRIPQDQVHYTDDDLQWLHKNGQYIATKKDGTPYD